MNYAGKVKSTSQANQSPPTTSKNLSNNSQTNHIPPLTPLPSTPATKQTDTIHNSTHSSLQITEINETHKTIIKEPIIQKQCSQTPQTSPAIPIHTHTRPQTLLPSIIFLELLVHKVAQTYLSTTA